MNDITPGSNQPIDLNHDATYEKPENLQAVPEATPVQSADETHPSPQPPRPSDKKPFMSLQRMAGFALIIAAFGAGVYFVASAANNPPAASSALLAQLPTSQSVPLADVSQSLAAGQTAGGRQLTVNGQLNVTGPIVLVPSSQPTSAVAGELYYDQTGNVLEYYNGKQFLNLLGGGNVTNNVTNVTNQAGNTTNVTNLTDVTNVTNSAGGGVAAVGGTAGSLAYFTDATTLGSSMVTQSGNNLSTGNGVENVSLGSAEGASAALLQGGTGDVAIITGSSTGSSGNITLQSGDSSTTAAGNVSIDTGNSVLSGTLIDDKTFEDGIDNMGDGIFGDNSVITQTNAQAHSGTHSLSIAVGSNYFPRWETADGITNPPMIIPVTQGHTYAVEAWVRAATNSDNITAGVTWSSNGYYGGGAISTQDFGTVTDISTGWRKVVGVLTAPVGATEMGYYFSANDAQTIGEVHYIDDVTITDLSSSSATAALDLGATNAQEITIGNSAMLAPTSIYGGGVNISGGSGFINISGANIAATSGGASYTTTTGALDITAATSSTWKIAGSGGTGGDLTIAAGNAGGNGNGGNLVLQSGAAAGTGAGGSVIVQPGTDSSSAFQVQNASGNPSLNFDSGNGTLTVNAPTNCGVSTYENYVDSFAPDAYWKLDDTGATGADSSGNNNTGTLSNVTTNQTPGPFSCDNTQPAMAFNSASPSEITTANSATLPTTFSQVVMFNTTNEGELIGGVGGAAHDRELFIDGSGKLNFRIYNNILGNEVITSSAAVNDGSWHIAVASVSSAGMYLYVDGQLVASNPSYNTPQSYTGSWYIGDDPFNGPFTGEIAEVAVIPTALNSIQSQTLAADSGFFTGSTASVGIGTTTPSANLDVEGSAVFKDPADSTDAFAIQNAAGASLISADTTDMAIILGQDGTPQDLTVRGGEATGTNASGGNITFDASNGTGAAGSGSFIFRTAKPGASAVTVDNTGEIASFGSSTVTLSGFTTGSESNRLMLVQVETNQQRTFTAVTYNGLALTQIAAKNSPQVVDPVGAHVELWYLLNPPSGSYDIVATMSSAGTGSIGAATFYNVDQTTPLGTFATASGTTTGYQATNLLVPTTSTSQLVVDAIGVTNNNSSLYSADTQSQMWYLPNTSSVYGEGGADAPGTGGNVDMSWFVDTADWADIGVPINPVADSTTDSLSDSLVIDRSGNVGIGTSAPQQALQIANGNVSLDNNQAIYLNGPSDTAWTIGREGSNVTGANIVTKSATVLTVQNTADEGVMIRNAADQSVFEVSGLGQTLIKTPTDSTSAFQVQNQMGAAVLTADTTTMTVTVSSLVVTANLTVDGHIITGGSTPGIAAGAAANCSGTASVSVTGDDTSGTITITTGAGPCSAAGDLADITFSNVFGATPNVVLTPAAANGSALQYYTSPSTTGFSLETNSNNLSGATTYKYSYFVTQ